MNMKKKMYSAPSCEVVEMEIVSMIAASVDVGTGNDSEYNNPEDMSNKHRGEWGNLWN